MKLLVTRHGQTEDNVRGITMGHRDSVLTIVGIDQAKNKALSLKQNYHSISKVYTSDISRCVQTATIIANQLVIKNGDILIEAGLREICFGEYEGLPYVAIPSNSGDYMTTAFPSGESNRTMSRRVIDTINKVYRDNEDSRVLVVTHSGPIAAIVASFYGQDLQTALNDKIDNQKIIELSIKHRLSYPDLGTK